MVASSGQSYSYSVGRGRSRGIGYYRARVAAGHDLETKGGFSLSGVAHEADAKEEREREREHFSRSTALAATGLCCAERCGVVLSSGIRQSVTLNRCDWEYRGFGSPWCCGSWGGKRGSCGNAGQAVVVHPNWPGTGTGTSCMCLCLAMAGEGPERTAHSADPSRCSGELQWCGSPPVPATALEPPVRAPMDAVLRGTVPVAAAEQQSCDASCAARNQWRTHQGHGSRRYRYRYGHRHTRTGHWSAPASAITAVRPAARPRKPPLDGAQFA
ncbi:hypothetical protein TgHK011_008410 [Trichoderma gracile]|nr:hypothetical protein TgHK011_008410 [Trichoderma gracile]